MQQHTVLLQGRDVRNCLQVSRGCDLQLVNSLLHHLHQLVLLQGLKSQQIARRKSAPTNN